MAQEELRKSFEKTAETMKVLSQNFEELGKRLDGKQLNEWLIHGYVLVMLISFRVQKFHNFYIFIGKQSIFEDVDENNELFQELRRIGFQELFPIFSRNGIKLAEEAWDLDFQDLRCIGVSYIQAKKFVQAVERDVSGE